MTKCLSCTKLLSYQAHWNQAAQRTKKKKTSTRIDRSFSFDRDAIAVGAVRTVWDEIPQRESDVAHLVTSRRVKGTRCETSTVEPSGGKLDVLMFKPMRICVCSVCLLLLETRGGKHGGSEPDENELRQT